MRPIRSVLACASLLVPISAASPAPMTAQDLIARLSDTWDHLQSYTCTWTVHEVRGDQVQDRVYHISFQKPLETRAEVVDGDGKGSVAVWDGGDRVRGHQGGILRFIKLNVNIHNRLAVSLRGATIAQINAGWFLQHLKDIGAPKLALSRQGENTVISAFVHDPPPDTDVVREVYVLAPNGLPLEAFQYGSQDVLLKHVVFSDYQLNVDLPASTWQI
jgi:outer membrane lipoprotein-sorting protein